MKTTHHTIKPAMKVAQRLNYIALALMELAGNDLPQEAEIQKVERRLQSIVRESYLKNLTNQQKLQ